MGLKPVSTTKFRLTTRPPSQPDIVIVFNSAISLILPFFYNLQKCLLESCLFVPVVSSVVLGTLYPAYASYKAVKTKNVKEYVSFRIIDYSLSFQATIQA